MGKLLVLIGLVLVLLAWVSGRGRRSSSSTGGDSARRGGRAAEEMVRCAHCGVHLPRGDALFDGSRPYCSETHRLAGPQPGAPS